ncbi:MAG: recombinase family protein, partial [Syntrophobacteraceae bacterium]
MKEEYLAEFVVERQPKAYSYLRFSRPEQEDGDSIRRQTEISEEWARSHDHVLDGSLKMEDHGLSAFHGKHVSEGALGQFLEKVKAGQIPQGSVLLVESLDRLSREELTEALEQFLAIIRNGIKIVTLADNAREYTKETINSNMGDLFVGLSIMVRAHEESKMKSFRLSKA